jgi:hypothetical protein
MWQLQTQRRNKHISEWMLAVISAEARYCSTRRLLIHNYLENKGIIMQTITPETPWYNGKIERAGKSITSYTRTVTLIVMDSSCVGFTWVIAVCQRLLSAGLPMGRPSPY